MGNRILLVMLMCGPLASTFDAAWAINQYFFEPETLSVHPGDTFAWNLMMENDFGVFGYRFRFDAPSGGATIFDPDTMTVDWTGTEVDSFLPAYVEFDFYPGSDYFAGYTDAERYDSVIPGTYIAAKLLATVSDTASPGLYEFSPVTIHCRFTDWMGDGIPVDAVAPGYIKIQAPECGDVNLDRRVTVADAIYITSYIYRGGPAPCEPAR